MRSLSRFARSRTAMAVAVGLGVLGLTPATVSAATPAGLPAIHHVWQIQLENESAATTFSPTSPATYLNQTLVPEGVFLPNYYGTGHVSLDNYLSEESGLPGNAATFSDCQDYVNFTGVAYDPVTESSPGVGCVYPASVQTLPDQLTAAGLTWHGYMEDMGNTPTRETTSCGQPTAGSGSTAAANPGAVPPVADDTQTATATDQYAARHNPFAYFHSLLDSGACAANVVPLRGLAGTLSSPTPPNYNWITPNLCDDGHDAPCKGADITGANPGPGGLTSADAFLHTVVPEIMASPAYQADGLIVISFDEAATTDPSSCCGEVPGTTGVVAVGGGGRTGALLISPLLAPHTSTVAYNHFSLLRSLEDLYGITTGGSDGAGHLGEAAVAPAFGADVYTSGPVAATPEIARPALLVGAAGAIGGVALLRRRHISRRSQHAHPS